MTISTDMEVKEEILIKASRERVFRALTDASEITAWWCLPGRYSVDEAEIDLTVGGVYRFSGTNSNSERFLLTGVFLVVDPPSRLEYTWVPDWNEDACGSVVAFQLETVGEYTRLLLTHSGFLSAAAREEHRQGWPAVLCAFAEHVSPN